MTIQSSLDVVARSATTTPPPSVRSSLEIAKLIDDSKCIGCKACQVACAQWNELNDVVGANTGVYDNPHDLSDKSWTLMRFNEVEFPERLEWLIRKDGCMHCEDPGCLKACPTGAITFGSKVDMLSYAETRVGELKERGLAQAAVYNPVGVGGTHVMYVLRHGDNPELYSGLPKNPSISGLVGLWKSAAKPLAIFAMLGAVALSFFHYIKVGSIEPKEDETV